MPRCGVETDPRSITTRVKPQTGHCAATIWKPVAQNPSPMNCGRSGGCRLAVSQADGTLYFISNQGFVRLDPETGFAEVVSEEHLESFDLSPDGRRAVGIKEGEVMLVNLEFPSSTPLQVDSSGGG